MRTWANYHAEKEEDVGDNGNKVFDENLKFDAPNREINLFEFFEDNVGCDDLVKEIKDAEEKMLKASDEKEGCENKRRESESEESLVKPKLEDKNRSVFDRGKLIKSRDPISDVHRNEVGVENNDNGDKATESKEKINAHKGKML
ncbi:5637_t:CDS:2 [Dentiscutata erythropus]|uniref:5637_t:CDS:1 n=1 Tax=Dentiscutata erythropus TaxID=1348616 RepID=A0A9N8WDW6_9GLOM|nr:5637_t:CDS:2 [Dentiscutata erythropus]